MTKIFKDPSVALGESTPSEAQMYSMKACLAFYWVLTLTYIGLFLACLTYNYSHYLQTTLIVIFTRQMFVFFNFEQRHLFTDEFSMITFLVIQIFTLIFLTIMLYLSLKNSQHI